MKVTGIIIFESIAGKLWLPHRLGDLNKTGRESRTAEVPLRLFGGGEEGALSELKKTWKYYLEVFLL